MELQRLVLQAVVEDDQVVEGDLFGTQRVGQFQEQRRLVHVAAHQDEVEGQSRPLGLGHGQTALAERADVRHHLVEVGTDANRVEGLRSRAVEGEGDLPEHAQQGLAQPVVFHQGGVGDDVELGVRAL